MSIDALFFAIAVGAYQVYPAMQPKHMDVLHVIGTAGLFLLGFMWRVLLLREHRSLRLLLLLDSVLVIGISVIFGVLAGTDTLSPDEVAALDGRLHPGRLLASLHGSVKDMDQLAARLPTEDLLADPPLPVD